MSELRLRLRLAALLLSALLPTLVSGPLAAQSVPLAKFSHKAQEGNATWTTVHNQFGEQVLL